MRALLVLPVLGAMMVIFFPFAVFGLKGEHTLWDTMMRLIDWVQ